MVPHPEAEYPAKADKLNIAEDPVRFTLTGLLAANTLLPRNKSRASESTAAVVVVRFVIMKFLIAQKCAARGAHPVFTLRRCVIPTHARTFGFAELVLAKLTI